MKKQILLLFAGFVLWTWAASATEIDFIRCASTSSTQNSGLFNHILPVFEAKTGIRVHVIAVGTGAALEIGKRGDVDLVFVHAKIDELRMIEEGWFKDRRDVMYNNFVLVGPASDPAGLKSAHSAGNALKRIFETRSLFISRGDNSGTHKMEMRLWAHIGMHPGSGGWYLESGQGMAKTLRIAANKNAYALSDKGTFLSLADRNSLGLFVLFEGDPLLFNQYGVMLVNPEKHAHIKSRSALIFIDWLTSKEGQETIGTFKDLHGNQLFFPNALQTNANGIIQK
ncbi:MAG: substrate-binding domain-containing protein [SAR324 cluster bacterium]|nr:substrate-binding domain-containing protein [SAR324 cluster bacterium]